MKIVVICWLHSANKGVEVFHRQVNAGIMSTKNNIRQLRCIKNVIFYIIFLTEEFYYMEKIYKKKR